MGRVIKLNGVGKERTSLTRGIVLAIRELAQQNDLNDDTRDLAAFIALALEAIAATIDPSVEAWEKRGYWLKADRFRMEWAWSEQLGKKMRDALQREDWAMAATTVAQVAAKLQNVDVPQRHRLGTPWVGAWKQFLAQAG